MKYFSAPTVQNMRENYSQPFAVVREEDKKKINIVAGFFGDTPSGKEGAKTAAEFCAAAFNVAHECQKLGYNPRMLFENIKSILSFLELFEKEIGYGKLIGLSEFVDSLMLKLKKK